MWVSEEVRIAATEAWASDPVFTDFYHETGYMVATTGKAPQKAITHLEEALKSVQAHPSFRAGILPLNGAKDFQKHACQFLAC